MRLTKYVCLNLAEELFVVMPMSTASLSSWLFFKNEQDISIFE